MALIEELILGAGEIAVLGFELFALLVMICTGVKGAFGEIKGDKHVALNMLKGFSIGLSFLLGAEILKTVALEDATDLMMVGGVVIMRVALSILIHWEMNQEQHEQESEMNFELCEKNKRL